MTPTARSMAWLRRQGWQVGVVEKWNAHVQCRQDLWYFADLIACHPEHGIALVQVTSAANMSARVGKILGDEKAVPRAIAWLRAGGSIYVHGWGRRGPKDAKRVAVRIRQITLMDFGGMPAPTTKIVLTGRKPKPTDRTMKLFA